MAYTVKEVINKTDAELDVVNKAEKSVEPIPPNSSKALSNENLLDLTFVSRTKRPIYIKITSVVGDGDVGDGDEGVIVKAGDPEEEEGL